MKRLILLVAGCLAGAGVAAAETKAPTPAVKTGVPNAPAAAAVPLRPDLKITAKPNDGVGPLFDFKIENIGNVKSQEVAIQFWAVLPCDVAYPYVGSAGKLLNTGQVKALVVTTSPSYAFSYSFEMPPPVRGCALKAVLDPDNHLLEARKDNNEVLVQTHLPPAPDLVPIVSADEYSMAKVQIKNVGNATAGPSVVWVDCNSTGPGWPCDPQGKQTHKSWTWNVPSLAPGQAHVFSTPLAATYMKWLYVVADSTHVVGERNENNNVWDGQGGAPHWNTAP